jgi:hypothetical protein
MFPEKCRFIVRLSERVRGASNWVTVGMVLMC